MAFSSLFMDLVVQPRLHWQCLVSVSIYQYKFDSSPVRFASSQRLDYDALYPAAVPTTQKYLAMNGFLVLMWMRQQPATAEIAKDAGFAHFYAELKAGIM
jgi:hypothetical protein